MSSGPGQGGVAHALHSDSADNFTVIDGGNAPVDEGILSYLFGATAAAQFFATTFERESLVSTTRDPGRFTPMISIADVDHIVTGTDLKQNDLLLADAGRDGGIESDDYVDDQGFIDRGAVAAEYEAGATIILNQAQRIVPALGQFCQALEHAFSSHVQTNLYLTPPGAQGFPSHFDNHDVLVLQVEGEKLWRLYDQPVATPFRGERFDSSVHDRGPIRHEFILRAGDCAYIPRGLMHDAETSGDQPSLHVAVGIIAKTWADLVLEAVSEVALREPAFRRSLPPAHARDTFDRSEAHATLAELGQILARELRLDPAMDVLADTFVRTRPACNRDRILHSRALLAPDALLRRVPTCALRVRRNASRLLMVVPGGELLFAIEVAPLIDRILSGEAFSLNDLADERADAIIRQLMAYGVVVPLS